MSAPPTISAAEAASLAEMASDAIEPAMRLLDAAVGRGDEDAVQDAAMVLSALYRIKITTDFSDV